MTGRSRQVRDEYSSCRILLEKSVPEPARCEDLWVVGGTVNRIGNEAAFPGLLRRTAKIHPSLLNSDCSLMATDLQREDRLKLFA